MVNERLREPVDDEYIQALGLATFAFARCEWQAVCCCEKIKPGTLQKLKSEKATAGEVAIKFVNIVRNMPRSNQRESLAQDAQEFLSLVDTRNKIAHGKPCTDPNGSQRLSSGGIIKLGEINEAADQFASCGIGLILSSTGF